MDERRRAEVDVEIVRFVSDEPQPGLIECVLVDAGGARHRFIDKTAIFARENLSAANEYPTSGVIACEVEAEWCDQGGRRLARIDTARPWGIEASDGATRFVVLCTQLRR